MPIADRALTAWSYTVKEDRIKTASIKVLLACGAVAIRIAM
jgi:hypothetical protein